MPVREVSHHLGPVVEPFFARVERSSVVESTKCGRVLSSSLAGNGAIATVLSKDSSDLLFTDPNGPDSCFDFDDVE